MAGLVLEGDTLGRRQKHYNELLKEAITKTQTSKIDKINPDENDIDNLFKIDIASNNRDVEYILEVLKSEDMLYVSRAIKRCTWLITDQQYAHVINPEYLHSQLFPHMLSKASNKLMKHIRRNLRDESRFDAFYNYCKDKNLNTTLKWLPYCSPSLIEKEIIILQSIIINENNMPTIKRICERSIKYLEILCKLERKSDLNYQKKEMLKAMMFLINTNTEQYLNIVDAVEPYYRPYFGAKAVKLIMRKCPERITDNFSNYADFINLEAYAKLLKKDAIIDFLLRHAENENLRLWFTFDNLKYFVKHIPKEGRFDFIQKIFIEKGQKDVGDKKEPDCSNFESDVWWPEPYDAMLNSSPIHSEYVYCWYQFAPFDVAFTDLTNLICSKSLPAERNSLLAVLVTCAGRNLQHTHTVLQYYHDKHIDEPFNFKVQFVNVVLSKTATHKYDEKTWNILNSIFYSMGVYIESNNDVQSCIQAIIIYKILHNEKVSKTLERKFNFSSLKINQVKYNSEENETIFNYLLSIFRTKTLHKSINNETQLKEAVTLLESVLSLLIDWKRELIDYSWMINKIKEITKMQNKNGWKTDLLSLFNKKKSWRKLMFEESLVMSPTEEACLNALKHDPELLTRHNSEVEALQRNDAVSLRRLLSKLRIYWPQTLARDWADSYLERLQQPGGHKPLASGLCILLPQKRLLGVLNKYAPIETKINYSKDDDTVLSLRKHIANNMHLARPLLLLDAVLPYAQGHYLQHVLPSLNAILYNVSSARSREYIPKLLGASVSLIKRSIRFAFAKLNSIDLKQTLSDIWKSTKDPTIRAVIFKTTYDLLCKEKSHSMIEEMWEVLSIFIDNVSADDSDVIFEILGTMDKVPLIIKADYFMKSYNCLMSLSAKDNCKSIAEKLTKYIERNMEFLRDEDLAANIMLKYHETKFTKDCGNGKRCMEIWSSFLLCAKNEESQTQRYERILVPLLENDSEEEDGIHNFRNNVFKLLKQLCRDFSKYVFRNDMVYPIKMFTAILHKLEETIPEKDCYVLLRSWKLTVSFVKLLERHKTLVSSIQKSAKFWKCECYHCIDHTWDEVYVKASFDFSKACLQYLKEDIEKYGSSVWIYFAMSFKKMYKNFGLDGAIYLETIKSMLENQQLVESYLMALEVMPGFYWGYMRENLSKICKLMYSHPSIEVKMHYYRRFSLGEDFENN